MRRGGAAWRVLLAGLAALALGARLAAAEPALPRVMSLNLCTDQLVLELAEPGQIVSLSVLVDDPALSFHRARATGLPRNSGRAEEVLSLRPDIAVTGTFALGETARLLEALGMRVEAFDYTQTLDTIPADLERMGALLGRPEAGAAAAARFEAGLRALRRPVTANSPRALIYGQNGVVSGTGTLADSALAAAGLRNQAAEQGISGVAPYPLELLLADPPDILILSGPGGETPALADLALRHPALRGLPSVAQSALLPPGALSCGGAFTLQAVRALAALAGRLGAGS